MSLHSETRSTSILSGDASRRASAAVAAALLGMFLLYGVGFAQPQVLHNAAHDTRHAFTFPCH